MLFELPLLHSVELSHLTYHCKFAQELLHNKTNCLLFLPQEAYL